MRVFITDDGFSYNSFLECIADSGFTAKDLDKQAVLEFLIYGELYFDRTFVKKVRKEFNHQPYLLSAEKGFLENIDLDQNPLVNKSISDPMHQFIHFFEKRKEHLNQRNKISIDLTGGIDSRLIASTLQYLNIPFEAVFSLDSGTEKEATIVKKVANELGVKLHIVKSNEVSSKSELKELFRFGDGCWDLLGMKSLRNTQNWRKENGADLVITGVGGELYKDFFWQQDFPFYQSPRSSIKKLVNLRMYPLDIKSEWLPVPLRSTLAGVQKDFIERLNGFKSSINTKTYDQIYYNVRVKEQISLISSATLNYLETYSPLLEAELLNIGYNLPRRKRFMNRFHRELISKMSPQVAKIPTTEGGMSVSDNGIYIAKDLLKYGIDKSKKIVSKLILKSKENGNTVKEKKNDLVDRELKKAVQILKSNDILNSQLKISELPQKLKGRIITVSYVINELER
ncbi:MAG: asparagine synthase-related protein [Balneolaceae bacterium]